MLGDNLECTCSISSGFAYLNNTHNLFFAFIYIVLYTYHSEGTFTNVLFFFFSYPSITPKDQGCIENNYYIPISKQFMAIMDLAGRLWSQHVLETSVWCCKQTSCLSRDVLYQSSAYTCCQLNIRFNPLWFPNVLNTWNQILGWCKI